MTFEDKDGFPWTASVGLGWIVLILALTSGTAALFLGIYLSLWIRLKGRSVLPLYCYILVAAFGVVLLLPFRIVHPLVWDSIDTLVGVLWLVAAFFLRREIQLDARSRGYEIELGVIMTLLFSVVYLNYCLNPVTLFDSKNAAPTSLNLNKR
jgi:hypothetical protein